MRKRSFLFITAACMIAVFTALFMLSVLIYEHSNLLLSQSLETVLTYIQSGLTQYGQSYLDELPQQVRITWIDADGTVIYDNATNTGQMDNHAQRDEVLQAQHHDIGKSIRFSETFFQKTLYSAVQLEDHTIIRVSLPGQSYQRIILTLAPSLLIVLISVLLITLFLSSLLSKCLVRPIQKIDIDHPDIASVDPEFESLITHIAKQKATITHQAEQLSRKQDEVAVITENMQEGFLLTDAQGRVLSCNVSALNALKLSSAVSLNLIRCKTYIQPALQAALSGKRHEGLFSTDTASTLVVASPVSDGMQITGAVLFMLDMTEKQQREMLRREFTSNVSHELKTPLTTIHGISELLQNNLIASKDIARFAKNIHTESGRMITLIQDILKLSQLDENAVPFPRQDVDLYALSAAVIQRLMPIAKSRNITLTLEGDHAMVHGVPTILDEMVYNLCDNAIKYNRQSGQVIVSIYDIPHRPRVVVQDTGIGISVEHIDRVFERFYRVDKSHSKEIGGTGLGLSIVKHGALFHRAKVQIDSAPGIGTTVTIQF